MNSSLSLWVTIQYGLFLVSAPFIDGELQLFKYKNIYFCSLIACFQNDFS